MTDGFHAESTRIPAPKKVSKQVSSQPAKQQLPKDDGSVSLHLTTEPRETDGVKDQLGGVL